MSYTFSLFLKYEMSYTSNGRREKQAPEEDGGAGTSEFGGDEL